LKEKNYSGVSSRRLGPGQQPAEWLGSETLPMSPSTGNAELCGADPPAPHPWGQGTPSLPGYLAAAARPPRTAPGVPPARTSAPRGRCHLQERGTSPVSDTRTGGTSAAEGERGRATPPPLLPTPVMLSHISKSSGAYLLFLKVYFQRPGLPKSPVRGWSRAGAQGGDGCHQPWPLTSGGAVPVIRSNTSSLGRLLGERADLGSLMNEDLRFN